MKQEYVDLLERVVEEFGKRMILDDDFLASLRLAKVIMKSEWEKLLDKKTTNLRLLLLFDEFLPLKDDSKMKELRDVFREAGNEVVANFLAREILAIEVAPESLPIASRSSTASRIPPETASDSSPLERGISICRPEMEELGRRMRKFFFGKNFTTIKIMTSDEIFGIEDMWVNLEMQTPEGFGWSPVEDYESSLTESLLENFPVIVRGEPGVGKSTLVKKICYDWAEKSEQKNSTGFGKFHLVLPCRLREAGPAESIPEMVLQWLKNSIPALRPTIKTLCENFDKLVESYRILFVLDGWDEDLGSCEELTNLLNFPRELEYFLLITTRPREMKPRDSRFGFFQIAGFNQSDKMKFIDKFSRLVGKRAESLKGELNAKRHLNEMARIPLLLVSICTVEAASSARNTSELFTIVVEFILRRHAEKGLLEFPEEWQSDPRIRELGKVALEGLLQKDREYQLVFKERNLQNRSDLRIPEILEIGLLCRENQHQLQQASYNVSFPHKTFQEFFAALFIRSRFGTNESLSKSLGTAEISEIEHWGRLLEQTTVFLIGLTQVGESEELAETLDCNRLLSILVSDEDNLQFMDNNPILRECKDDKTASAICSVAAKMYAKEHEHMCLRIDLKFKDFQLLLRSIGGMHFDEIWYHTDLSSPCFSFLSNADPIETPELSSRTDESSQLSQLSCDRLQIWSQDQDERLKSLGCFKTFRTLTFDPKLKRTSGLTTFDFTKLINSCPGDVQKIMFESSGDLLLPSPSPFQFFLYCTAASHPHLNELGIDCLGEYSLEAFLDVAAVFPALATLRIYLSDPPSTETISEKLIPALQRFPSLRVLGLWSVGGYGPDLIKKVRVALREAGMVISVEKFN